MIVIVTGCPCSGKSTVCRELEKYGFESISADRFFKMGKSKYDEGNSGEAYSRLFESLGKGDYIIDTPGNAAAFLQERKKLVHYTTVKLDASLETILYRYQHRWQANDIPPARLKSEYDESKRLKADITINTEGMDPGNIAKVIMQRLEHRQHAADSVHQDMFGKNPVKPGKHFLDELLD